MWDLKGEVSTTIVLRGLGRRGIAQAWRLVGASPHLRTPGRDYVAGRIAHEPIDQPLMLMELLGRRQPSPPPGHRPAGSWGKEGRSDPDRPHLRAAGAHRNASPA